MIEKGSTTGFKVSAFFSLQMFLSFSLSHGIYIEAAVALSLPFSKEESYIVGLKESTV